MKSIIQYNESRLIKTNNDTIRKIIRYEIGKLGRECDLNHIDVSEVTDMSWAFFDSKFNGDISLWNVQNVQNMRDMFWGSPFNDNISNWNVQNVQNTTNMFSFSKFNGDISNWNVGNVKNMYDMFENSPFNGDLSLWNVGNVENNRKMFKGSPLEGKEPWWYVLSPLFGSNYLMWDSLDFGWIDIEKKIIYRDNLSRILLRSYNTKWNGELPVVHNFTYK